MLKNQQNVCGRLFQLTSSNVLINCLMIHLSVCFHDTYSKYSSRNYYSLLIVIYVTIRHACIKSTHVKYLLIYIVLLQSYFFILCTVSLFLIMLVILIEHLVQICRLAMQIKSQQFQHSKATRRIRH